MTHVQQQRELFNKNKLRVLEILKWSEEKYYNFIMDQAHLFLLSWLDIHPGLTLANVMHWKSLKPFWNFWINQWNLRDNIIFLPNYESSNQPTVEDYYHQVHTPENVPTTPCVQMFEDAYCVFIGESIDEIVVPQKVAHE